MNCKNCKHWVFGNCVVQNVTMWEGNLCNAWELSLSHERVGEMQQEVDKIADLQARIAELEESQRWRVVADGELPDRDGFYLVLEDTNQVAGYYHWCKAFGWNTYGGSINIQSVTHWMPLPEPPKESEE